MKVKAEITAEDYGVVQRIINARVSGVAKGFAGVVDPPSVNIEEFSSRGRARRHWGLQFGLTRRGR